VEVVALTGSLIDHPVFEIEGAEIRKALRLEAGGRKVGLLTRKHAVAEVAGWLAALAACVGSGEVGVKAIGAIHGGLAFRRE
jgi:hypothetical protein